MGEASDSSVPVLSEASDSSALVLSDTLVVLQSGTVHESVDLWVTVGQVGAVATAVAGFASDAESVVSAANVVIVADSSGGRESPVSRTVFDPEWASTTASLRDLVFGCEVRFANCLGCHSSVSLDFGRDLAVGIHTGQTFAAN